MTSRRYPSFFTARSIDALEHRYGPKPPAGEPAKPVPIASRFTPSEQIALLSLRNNQLTRAVLAKLAHSTARASYHDYRALADQQLAVRNASGLHELTPQGHWIATRLAVELARTFEIDTLPYQPRIRGMYAPGVKARFNFW